MTKKNGFTFLEIIIAIAIIMVLALIAIPSLKERKARAHVDGAVQIGLKDAQFLQKWFTLTGRYSVKRNSSNGGCPSLPFRFYPEQNIESKVSSYTVKVESMYYFSTNNSSCKDNSFTVVGLPICDTIVKDMGAICIDQDGNVSTRRNKSCNNAGGIADCINRDAIPKESDNSAIDDNDPDENESGINPDDIPDPNYCLLNPLLPTCQSAAFCTKYKGLLQPQCKCVLDYKTNPECRTPDEAACSGDKLLMPQCACSSKRLPNPAWCKPEVDPSKCDPKNPETQACHDACTKDTKFCSCWEKPDSTACQNDCKTVPVTQRPSWCKDDKSFCELNHNLDECKTEDLCKKINYSTYECKCPEGVKTNPAWCDNITPDSDFCQLEENKSNPKCRKSTDIVEGDHASDKCNNDYICKKALLCNSVDKEKYAPGTGTNWSDAWTLNMCASGQKPNYPSINKDGYRKDSVIITSSCETYITKDNISGNKQDNPENQPDAKGGPWKRVYQSCHVDDEKYKIKKGDIISTSNGDLYECIDEKYCNICNPDGSDRAKAECSSTNGWHR